MQAQIEAPRPAATGARRGIERRGKPVNTAQKPDIQARHAGLARDLARAGYLLRNRAWRHVRDEFRGHQFVPLAAVSGAVADAMLRAPNDLIFPALVLASAAPKNYDMVADTLQALGCGHV